MRKVLVSLGCFLLLTGCFSERYGVSAQYRREAPEPINVVMPADAIFISQQFLVSRETTDRHEGIDLWGPRSTQLIAAAPGIVVASWQEPLYGNRIKIDHGVDGQGNRILTRYFHLESRSVEVGQRVARGEFIGRMGSTGVLAGGGVHLHFEVLVAELGEEAEPIDPHLAWADGVGRVTCFDPDRRYPEDFIAMTYPAACGG